MRLIKLTSAQFKYAPCYLFPDYVSNGHWAIRKSQVTNAALFATASTAQDFLGKKCIVNERPDNTGIEQIIKGMPEPQLWSATTFAYEDNGVWSRIFVNAVSGELMAFNSTYLDLFDLDHAGATLWGTKDQVCRDTQEVDDLSLLIMPVKLDRGALSIFKHATSELTTA